jgi:biotin carboxyl carrier protein
MAKFRVRSWNKTFEINVSGQKDMVMVNGVDYRIDFVQFASNLYSLMINENSFHFYLQPDGESVNVIQDGIEYTVIVEDELSSLLRNLQRETGARRSKIAIRAPMPGLVTKVEVSKGVQVELGGGLIILEAMKMENEIRAPAKGIVTEVLTEKGKPVERGEILLQMVV